MALFHNSMLRKDFIVSRIRLPHRITTDTSEGGSDLVANGWRMPDMDIDLERVISDPAYRRAVLDQLKSEANAKTDTPVAALKAEAPAPRDVRSK